MSVSSVNNNSYNNYNNYNNYNAQQTQQNQQTQQVPSTQPAQQNQPTQYQQNMQQDSFTGSNGQNPSSQPNLTGQPQYSAQGVTSTQQGWGGVPDLGANEPSSQGVNSAGVEKQSAKEVMDASNSKQTYPQNTPEDKGAGYGQEKQKMLDAATKAGASKEEAAIMTAQYMLEGGRDASKDWDGASKNYGPLNLNGDLLQKSGMSQGDMDKMNALGSDGKPTQEAMDLSAKAAHAAMKDMGVNGYLHHVRGGQTGYEKPNQQLNPGTQGLIQDDPDAFARSVAESAKKVLETGFDNNRYAANIPHI